MIWETWFTLSIVGLVFIGLLRNYATDALLLGAVAIFGLVGIISPEEMFSGFSNMAPLTVAALYVVAAALRETGALAIMGSFLLGKARTERGVLLRMSLFIPATSAFLNNTPIVSMFIPVILSWCKNNRISPSRLLLPLSYLAILGGTCTLIGTSTNLIINGLLIEMLNDSGNPDFAPISIFELSVVGIPYALIGIAYLLFVGRFLLPERKGFLEQMTDSAREYLVNMRIEKGCRLIDKTVEQAGLRHLPGLFLVEILHDGHVITPVGPRQVLEEGDILTFTGVVSTIVDLEKIHGLLPVADDSYATDSKQRRGKMLYEAVISRTSPLIGKNIRESNFRALYNAAVIAVHRGGERLKTRVGDINIRRGDTLLLQAGPHFLNAHRNDPDFFLVSGVEDSRAVRHDRAPVSLALLGLLIILMAVGALPIVIVAFLIAGLMIALRCISVADARQSLDWQTLLTICAAFGFAKALVNSGVISIASQAMVNACSSCGVYGTLAGIYLLTSVFAAIIGNNAAAALIFPFSIAVAVKMGISPRPFIMMTLFAASASFITPMSYQTNMMVYGPGGYRFSDFIRVGAPLNLILLILATVLVPWIWPF